MSEVQDNARTVPESPANPSPRQVRAITLIILVGVWVLFSMGGATTNTSWEHHPFGGPFILLKESRSTGDFVFTVVICVLIAVPSAHWAWTGRIWSAVAAVMMAGLSILLSMFWAASASC